MVKLSILDLNKKPYSDLMFGRRTLHDIRWSDVHANKRQNIDKFRSHQMVVLEHGGKRKLIKWYFDSLIKEGRELEL